MLTDLKLLVDVVWVNRSGQTPYALSKGEYAAADRLVKRGLLMNNGLGEVCPTGDGDELVRRLCTKVAKWTG